MKVTFVNYYYDKDIPIDNYLDKYPTIFGWSHALANLGMQIKVYHRFNEDYSFIQDDVKYILVKDNLRHNLKWYNTPFEFHKQIAEDEHDVIHVNSFNYTYQSHLLKRNHPNIKVVIQHHAENPRNPIKRYLLKYHSSNLDGFIFSSSEIYNTWLNKNLLPANKKFCEIMEGSSNLVFKNRNEARRKTGLMGKPVLLWVGRLNENKDPMTVLSGFKKLVEDFPDAKLYMIFSEENLKPQVLSIINQNKSISTKVQLLGFINHDLIGDYYNSADYFVLGSHYEGSGYSLVEAMSCGVVPIVTDIPAFRMITNKGKIGALWKCSDSDSFYRSAKDIFNKPIENESKKAIDYFSDHLSFPAIAKKAKSFYESLTEN